MDITQGRLPGGGDAGVESRHLDLILFPIKALLALFGPAQVGTQAHAGSCGLPGMLPGSLGTLLPRW